MSRTIGIGIQDFEDIRGENIFYIDKTRFIKEWWESADSVTLITRPRRFGKTLTMSMTEKFFSIKYAGYSKLFEGLFIWEDEKYRSLQGTCPVISLSFANIKDRDYGTARKKICLLLTELYSQNSFLMEGNFLTEREKEYFRSVTGDMDDAVATLALYYLSGFLFRYYKKRVIILLDEYDTPLQEAYVGGFWGELTGFFRSLFNAAFKTNPYLGRAIMTGITRISRESVFSDLNNLKVVTTTSNEYEDSFGFTEKEVFDAVDEFGFSDRKDDVKYWYDGFTFGRVTDIYNPWSVLNFLDTGKLKAYWANTSSNSLVGKLIREGNRNIKMEFEKLLRGETLHATVDEQIVYNHLDRDETAIWSLLLAGGYLKVVSCEGYEELANDFSEPECVLEMTNYEVKLMFRRMVKGWFGEASADYNDFVKALLAGDCRAMNVYINRVATTVFSFFDTGKNPSQTQPERFYHGFVLGLIVELEGRYVITSNRESGFGRYDVMLEPKSKEDDGIILEFKVHDPKEENTLEDTVREALLQIERQNYSVRLRAGGIDETRIRKYGFAFEGKKVLIGCAV